MTKSLSVSNVRISYLINKRNKSKILKKRTLNQLIVLRLRIQVLRNLTYKIIVK